MDEQKIPFYCLDGSLDSKMQDQCFTDFKNSQTTHILMASLQTAGVGLNIT
jgi:SNF2 family DNA or RNA helicase